MIIFQFFFDFGIRLGFKYKRLKLHGGWLFLFKTRATATLGHKHYFLRTTSTPNKCIEHLDVQKWLKFFHTDWDSFENIPRALVHFWRFTPAFWLHHVDGWLHVRFDQWLIDFERQPRHEEVKHQPLLLLPGTKVQLILWIWKCPKLQGEFKKKNKCAKCRYLLNMMLTCGSIGKMQQIQSRIEHFITEAHEGQNILLVIESHNKILTWIKEFVRCFPLHRGTEEKNQPFS